MTYDPIDTSATDNAADGSVTTDTLDSTTVNNSGTVTTQDIVVNGTATGVGGVFAPVLEAGDTITVAALDSVQFDETFATLYSGTAKDVLGGSVLGVSKTDFLYRFSDNTTLTKNGGVGATTYQTDNGNRYRDSGSNRGEVDILPPAKDVIRIEVGASTFGLDGGAEVLLKD